VEERAAAIRLLDEIMPSGPLFGHRGARYREIAAARGGLPPFGAFRHRTGGLQGQVVDALGVERALRRRRTSARSRDEVVLVISWAFDLGLPVGLRRHPRRDYMRIAGPVPYLPVWGSIYARARQSGWSLEALFEEAEQCFVARRGDG
jgi:hypothetical protein